MNENYHRNKQLTIYHPRRLAKGELAAMLGFSRSDKMIPMFKEKNPRPMTKVEIETYKEQNGGIEPKEKIVEKSLLDDLDWTVEKYLKIQVFNMAQTKDVLIILFQKEFLIQQNINEIVEQMRLNKNGQTTITFT